MGKSAERPVHVGRAWEVILTDLGVDRHAVLRRAGHAPTLFDGDGTYITVGGLYRLYDALLAETGDPRIALGAGQIASVELFDPALFAAICSRDFEQATSRLGQFKRLVGAFTLDVTTTGTHATVVYRCKHRRDMPLLMGLSEMVFLVALARRATRAHLTPAQVTLQHVPNDVAPFEDFFGCQLQESDDYSIVLQKDDATRPFLTHNDAMWESFAPALRERTRASVRQETTSAQVRIALLELLPSGRASLQDVASFLAVGVRTLQRRLSSEGTNWGELLNKTRAQLACHYLESTSMTVPEISFLLGFEDPNSLYRAFRRWTGSTPEEWRTAPPQ